MRVEDVLEFFDPLTLFLERLFQVFTFGQRPRLSGVSVAQPDLPLLGNWAKSRSVVGHGLKWFANACFASDAPLIAYGALQIWRYYGWINERSSPMTTIAVPTSTDTVAEELVSFC